jgi:mgtE-like transporter
MTVREVALDAYREALPALVASLLGGLLAGVVLSGMRPELREVPGLLVLIPALLATRGNVYGSFGARVATALHQGFVEPRLSAADRRLGSAATAAIANGLLASTFASVVVFALLTVLDTPVAPLPTLVGIALVAGVLSGAVLTVVVVSVVFAGYRRGRDPDTLVGPIVTTTGDVFGVLFLLLAVRLVLGLGVGGGG